MTVRSALYVGQVRHHRFRPKPHSLAYRVFWMLLDLDEIDALAERSRLFSRNRFNLYAFRDACWHSWPLLIRSMESLRPYRFRWVLPGHGRRFHADTGDMAASLEACILWMRSGVADAGE